MLKLQGLQPQKSFKCIRNVLERIVGEIDKDKVVMVTNRKWKLFDPHAGKKHPS